MLLMKQDSTYSLCMKIRGMALGIEEVTLSARVVNAVQFPLPHEQVRLS